MTEIAPRKGNFMKNNCDILICDDEKVHADLIRFCFIRAGITNPVFYFDSGKDLLNHLESIQPVLQSSIKPLPIVLLDIRMPDINGMEILGEIKADPVFKDIPVVMVTTADEPEDIDKCLNMGCNGYITKPIYYTHLIDTMQRVLSNSVVADDATLPQSV